MRLARRWQRDWPIAVALIVFVAVVPPTVEGLLDGPDSPVAATADTTSTTPTSATTEATSTTTATTVVPPSSTSTTVPEADVTPIESASPVATGEPAAGQGVWFSLADCETGKWERHADDSVTFVPGSAVWTAHDSVHQGGLQFAVSTWDGFKPAGFPEDAHEATVDEQITVGKIVLDAQGPNAWPTCGPMVGLTRENGR